VDGTNAINIQVAANTSLTPTALNCYLEVTLLSGSATVTIP
jgi:hypothetical protein